MSSTDTFIHFLKDYIDRSVGRYEHTSIDRWAPCTSKEYTPIYIYIYSDRERERERKRERERERQREKEKRHTYIHTYIYIYELIDR